jgi:hypothetical protein
MKFSKLVLAGSLAAIPSALSLILYLGPIWVVLGYGVGLFVWAGVVGTAAFFLRRTDIYFSGFICFLVTSMLCIWYVYISWVPDVLNMESGSLVLVKSGVATSAYYWDLLQTSWLMFLGLVAGIPIFSFFARQSV